MSSDAQRPAFVLTAARSGSTLVRFILDSHPDLVCPPETNIGQTCFGLARLWEILDPSPESAAQEFAPDQVPAKLPAEAEASIRGAIDEVYGRYMAKHGKRRWCDKSLDTTKMADLLANLYPAAQFVCLYRHCMDVVVSAIEAAPWGVRGYGLEPYVIASPGNMVLAVARSWLDTTRTIIDFQAKYPDRCHGIRYEDLVTSPEEIAQDLLAFLDLAPQPGITQACLARAHDSRGPADHKIWFTKSISTDSLGQGTRVPVTMLPPEFLAQLNDTLDQLGYRRVDDAWRASAGPIDPRAGAVPGQAVGLSTGEHDVEAAATDISIWLSDVPAERARELAERWPDAARTTLCLAIEPAADGPESGRCWTVSYQDPALIVQEAAEPPPGAGVLAGSARTWLALLAGTANVATELRAGRLRFLDPAGDGSRSASRSAATQLLAHLIGLGGPTGTRGMKETKAAV